MAVTAQLNLNSNNLTSDILNVVLGMTITTDGSASPTESRGVSRQSGLNSRTTLFASSGFSGSIVVLKNTDTTYSNTVTVEVGTQEVGILNGGEWALFPWSADADLTVTASDAGTILEYALIER